MKTCPRPLRTLTFGLVALALGLTPAAAQDTAPEAGTVDDMLASLEAYMLEQITNRFRDFKYVKTTGVRYPERYNATQLGNFVATGGEYVDPSAWPGLPRPLITLHDVVTGEPLETCALPCQLHMDTQREYMISGFVKGHFSLPRPIRNPVVRRSEEPDWPGVYELNVGHNVYSIEAGHRACEAEFRARPMVNGPAAPCLRYAPTMPPIDYSGYCIMNFDITEGGTTENIRRAECSDPAFEAEAWLAVSGWKYHPAVERGVRVPHTGVETKLVFNVTDYEGRSLDENGELAVPAH